MIHLLQYVLDELKIVFKRKGIDFSLVLELLETYRNISIGDLTEISKEEVASCYKSLKYVEQAFRTMKTTELETRPIRHWTPERVKGHVFMCFLAYRVIYEARKRWAKELERDPVTRECEGDSLREMWAELDRITAGYVRIGNELRCQVGRITERQKHYLEELRAPVRIRLGS